MNKKKKIQFKCLAQIQLERLNEKYTVIKEKKKEIILEVKNEIFLHRDSVYDAKKVVLIEDKFLKSGMSGNGGWNKNQLELFGISWPPHKGWKKEIIGKIISTQTANKFLELGRKKTIKIPRAVKVVEPVFVKPKEEISWQEQYNHPNWQRVRLAIFNRDNFTCRRCGDNQSQLHVHHKKYSKGFIWEIDPKYLITLCDKCHLKAHDKTDFSKNE